jgi:hypothetical protein
MKDYSTIRLKSYKAHIHNYSTNKTLCGFNRFDMIPFILNKTRYNAKTMLEKHEAFATRRGSPNPYKWTCIKCRDKIERIINTEKG